jgi:hypothetical protein
MMEVVMPMRFRLLGGRTPPSPKSPLGLMTQRII